MWSSPSDSPARERAHFPPGFLWGVATSAYQIEGSPLADGAGESNWRRFAHTPGRITDGSTGDVACDHYKRYGEDVEIMARLGVNAYRFSLAWSRILPHGRGELNRRGIDFYSRLVDSLLEHGIRPFVTLHHWDMPAALEDSGGWARRESAGWFADYARIAFRALGDRVSLWATINEPWVIAHAGYVAGTHAPGRRDPVEAAKVAHNLLRAHGQAVRVARSEGVKQIGIVVNLIPKEPATESPEDRAASDRSGVYVNSQYLDPVISGRIPEKLPAIYGSAWKEWPAGDMKEISRPIDFVGVNYYTREVVRSDDQAVPDRASPVRLPDRLYTDTGWEVYPEGLVHTLLDVKRKYGRVPLFLTENGAAFPDPPHAHGARVHDPLRVEYYRQHLAAALEAIRLGVDLRGYFAWSLLDNMEWACGYTKRFGLVHVDFDTQKRTLKESALFYRDVIERGGANLV